MFTLDQLDVPIVQAPLAGGASTPELAAAVAQAGGLGFLAAGYKAPDAVRADVRRLRELSDRPFGVNVFAPPGPVTDPDAVQAYARRLATEADAQGVMLGTPQHDDDGWEQKLAVVIEERVPVVLVTFGCPDRDTMERLHDAGAAVWVTVTTPAEASAAATTGADALVVQGVEAGGHRGSFDDTAPGEIGLLALLALVRATVELPLVASGGIADGRGVAAVLAAGAAAAQLGSALMLTPEASTSPAHRQALAAAGATALTRAFTGRTARGILNRFQREHGAAAPSAYPDVHHLTAPLRTAARERGDADVFHLWAGQAHELARELPAAELVRAIAADAKQAAAAALDRLRGSR
jgi:nitronate monooxygenase